MLEMVIDSQALRSVLGRFATGIVVVTMRTGEGRPVGMTANSFTSVSLAPPIVSFCVSHVSRLHPLFTKTSDFAVNILADSQQELSRRFARPGLDRFGSLPYEAGRNGTPILLGSLAVIECATASVVAAGDHDIILGAVTALTADADETNSPLVFFNGSYRHLDIHNLAEQDADWWTAFT
jgi:flavin reductase (DIM6/NTAB) family NADH-FMN oxidoreductase RutF